MRRYGDDRDEMTASVTGDSGAGASAAMTTFLADLRAIGEGPIPEPSPELAALLDGDEPVSSGRVMRLRRRHIVLVTAASVLIGGTGAAAATGRLPQPAQRLVSDVIDRLTPFTVPSARPGTPSGPPAQAPPQAVVPVVPSRGTSAPAPGTPAHRSVRPTNEDRTGEPAGRGGSESSADAPGTIRQSDDRSAPTRSAAPGAAVDGSETESASAEPPNTEQRSTESIDRATKTSVASVARESDPPEPTGSSAPDTGQ
jgi:hypothetical protein